MLEQAPYPISWSAYLAIAARFIAGYVLAVAVGSIVFAVVAYLVPDMPLLPDPIENDIIGSIGQIALMYFILGAVFAIPYTVLGSLAFWFWLPRRPYLFLALGTLCPAAAIILMFSMIGGLLMEWRMLKLLLVTLPAGLAATYVYGAIGFGWGFGRWRLG